MMQGIVGDIVEKISGYKACKETIEIYFRYKTLEQKKEACRQWNAHRRRQYQAQCIVWIIMVYTMENEVQSSAPFRGWLEMEYKAVHHILHK